MFRIILVPLDGSDFAAQALPAALSLAQLHKGRIELVRVFEPLTPVGEIPFPQNPEDNQRLHAAASDALREQAETVARASGVEISWSVPESGTIAHAIEQAVADKNADALVMATHGRTGLARFWLGSIADRVIRHVHVPVLLIRPREENIDVKRSVRFRHVLVPFDGSSHAVRILDAAAALRSADTRYTLLLVQLPTYPLAPPAITTLRTPETDYAAAAEELKRALHTATSAFRARGLDVTAHVIEAATAVAGILSYAEANDVDVIAMAAHGRGGPKRLLLGSVADKVVRGAAIPVLLQRFSGP